MILEMADINDRIVAVVRQDADTKFEPDVRLLRLEGVRDKSIK